jgi:hypothetical protein
MPLPDGKLTEAELLLAQQKLQQFWTANGGRKPCPTCGSSIYHVIPQLNGNRSDTLNTMEKHFRFPTVMVTCGNCGYLDQYLASHLGIQWLLQPPPPPPPAPSPPLGEKTLGEVIAEALANPSKRDG